MSDYLAKRSGAAIADRAVAAIARRQHGVVAVAQLRAAGLSKHDVLHRARTGRLHRLHRGVYAVGHAALSHQGLLMAAVLACGRIDGWRAADRATRPRTPRAETEAGRITVLGYWGAAVSHRSAAVLWGLLASSDDPVEVSVAGDGGRATRAGIRLHRSLTLRPALVTLHMGIPVTTPARTVADLRRVASTRARQGPVSRRELRQAIRQADVLGLPIEAPEHDGTRSDLERDFLAVCRRHRLPPPEVNVRVGPDLVDFLWPGRRLVVETDGYAFHRGRAAFQDDRERDLRLRANGYDVLRLSEKQVNEEPAAVAAVLRRALRL